MFEVTDIFLVILISACVSSSPGFHMMYSAYKLNKQCDNIQPCVTLLRPTSCSPPGSLVHGISQARILKYIAISFSKGFFQTRYRTCIYAVAEVSLPLSHWGIQIDCKTGCKDGESYASYIKNNSFYGDSKNRCQGISNKYTHRFYWLLVHVFPRVTGDFDNTFCRLDFRGVS